MDRAVFTPADLLLPLPGTEKLWSVIACDQFTSDPAYWRRVEDAVGSAPSSLRITLPEAYLSRISMTEAAPERNRIMEEYLRSGCLRSVPGAFVYVERTVTGGYIRRGIVGKLDLDAYDWHPGADVPIRASEKTVPERLPPRIAVRRGAALDLPHIMVLMEDPGDTVTGPLTARRDSLPLLYDFDLMEGGGHICGRAVTGEEARRVVSAIAALPGEAALVIGDGNHSLAAAKAVWEEIKPTLTPAQRENHPARFALCEVCSVYDEGVRFEPIHRAVLHTDETALLAFLRERFTSGTEVLAVTADKKMPLFIPGASLGGVIGTLQKALEEFVSLHGGAIDYIHDDEAALGLGSEKGNLSVLLPGFQKSQLFRTVLTEGVFPKKSFSIGHARDKRYYLECRSLKPAEEN